MIAKNDEVKRSQIWRIVMTVSSVLIIVGAVLLLMKLFTTNPLEGEWTDEDGIFDMSISKDGTLVYTIPEAEEAASVDVDMRYTLNKEEKTITITADESGFGKIADETGGQFTEEEVRKLCMQYHVDYFEIRKWYDGYLVGNINIYNPKSVVDVLMWKKLKSYWTGTETYEALKIYIDLNFDGLKEAVIEMLGNGRYKINPRKFQNDMTTFTGKDDVLTLLVHLGYLTFNEVTEEVSIPNQEIVQEFLNAVDNPNWGGIMQSVRCSINILKSTWSMDGKSVADGIAAIHNANASILKYNDENSLKWTILLAYYSASIYYLPPNLEFPSGKGFADVVYLPKRDIAKPALLIELKWNKSAKGAISQIRDKQYADWIKEYTGDILLVGINYDDEKGHECMIEKFVKR